MSRIETTDPASIGVKTGLGIAGVRDGLGGDDHRDPATGRGRSGHHICDSNLVAGELR